MCGESGSGRTTVFGVKVLAWLAAETIPVSQQMTTPKRATGTKGGTGNPFGPIPRLPKNDFIPSGGYRQGQSNQRLHQQGRRQPGTL